MKIKIVLTLLSIASIVIIGLECCKQTSKKSEANAPNAYMGNESCKSCHKVEHEQWMSSHHYLAMQPATDSFVLGDFNNAVFTADGVTSKFFKKDGKFFINTQGPDGSNQDYEVKYTFGFTPLQQYLVEFPGGRMQATRASWDTKQKKWFHQYAGNKIPAGDWLHWTGNGQNWNTMCASCHSTNVNKGYDVATDTYHTTYNDINVSCESCHGPGKNHIDYINGDDYKAGRKTAGSLLMLYNGEGQMAQVNMCGYCHARRVDITGSVTPGKELLNDMLAELPTTTFFYADGQMRDEDYNYTSFLQSRMFHKGVVCSNCHDPHSAKLKLEGQIVCSQCHDPNKYNQPTHTMHTSVATDVTCITCHMPSKLYMGNDLRHDHSFRIPRPDLSVKYGTPNTCNACHKDKTAQWAADKIVANFGSVRRYHFSEDLIPGSMLNEGSEKHLDKLLTDTAIPNIVRAAAIHYLGQMNSASAGQSIVNKLNDSSALVRQSAIDAVTAFPASFWMNAAAPLLRDEVRAIRIGAANLFMNVPAQQMPSELFDAFSKAKAELDRFIIYQTDFAQGNVQAGDYFRKQNDFAAAEKYYRRAIAKDSQLTIARVNLSSALNATGKNAEALQQLLIAAKLEPKSDHIIYSLGLLYAEMSQPVLAAEALKKCIALNPQNIRAYYNYGLLMQQSGNAAAAEKVFLDALKKSPTDGDVLNALTILYIQNRQYEKAVATGKLLQQYHGNDPQYAELLHTLKLQ